MIRYLVFYFALFFLFSAYSQDDGVEFKLDSATYKRTYNSNWVTLQPFYGNVYTVKKEFQSYFGENQGNQLTTIGLKFGGPNNYSEEVPNGTFEYYLPRRWTSADNMQYKMDGFRIGLPLSPIGINAISGLKQVKYFQYALPISLNYGIGSLFLNENDFRYRNFFFDFNLSISPRIVLFDRLVVSSIIDFTADVTKKQWKTKDDLALFNEGFKRTGMSVFFSASWIFLNRSSYVRIYR